MLMHLLIKFFKLFEVQKNLKEMKDFFWHDESTPEAKAYISSYKDTISDIETQYGGRELSYEEHVTNMKKINNKLTAMSERGGDSSTDASNNFNNFNGPYQQPQGPFQHP
mmetsp:Transcript_39536/g.60375  ORF Transcript_39536/g.60375 Transcript_39536/m.60375 type:complete len:110 (-) Transcript_39536:1615-1944(-)